MGGIGDNLVAASVLRPLKKLGYMTEVLTSDLAQVVFHHNLFLDKLTVKKDGHVPGGAEWQKWFVSKSAEYDLFVHLSHSMELRHALFPDQTAFWWPQDYRREICAGSYLETVHKIAGLTPPYDFGPLFFASEEELDRARATKEKLGGPFIAWVLAGSRIDKVWPWLPLAISRVISEMDTHVWMFGAAGKQFDFAKRTMEHVQRTIGNVDKLHLALSPDTAEPGGDGHWPIRRSLSQLLVADLVVTPDTGAAWAVAFEPMPKIAMLSHASKENITKHWRNTVTLHADPDKIDCWPCHRLHSDPSTCRKTKDPDVEAAACMADISVDAVLDEVRRLWRKKDNVVRLEAAE